MSGARASGVVLGVIVAGGVALVLWKHRLAPARQFAVTASALSPGPAPLKPASLEVKPAQAAVSVKLKKKADDTAAAEARHIANVRKLIERRLAPLFAKLNLTPEQQEKLIRVSIDGHEIPRDTAATLALRGGDQSSLANTLDAITEQLKAENNEQVRALLGEAGYQAFLDNQVVVHQQGVIEHMQNVLKNTGAQLTDEQSAHLLSLMQERHTTFVSDEVISAAEKFLNKSQIDALVIEQGNMTDRLHRTAVQHELRGNQPQ